MHGILHAWVISGMTKDSSGNLIRWSGQSWRLNRLLPENKIRAVGIILGGITTIGFIGAGLGVFLEQDWWRMLALISAAIGVIVFVLSWKDLMPTPKYYIMGPILNVTLFLALIVAY
jgi:predicted MFS family arabinose efflux permease